MKKKILLFVSLILSLAHSTGVYAQCSAPMTITPTGNPGEIELEFNLGGVSNPSNWQADVYYNHSTVPNNFGNATITQSNNPDVVTLPSGGTYDFYVYMFDSNYTCMDSAFYTYTDNSQPSPCNTSLNSYAIDSTNLTFYFEVIGASGSATYSWDFGDGNTGTGNPVQHTYAPGYQGYLTTVTTTDINCSSTNSIYNVAGIYPVNCNATISTIASNTMGEYTFTALGNFSSYATYSWDFGDGNTGTGNSIVHQYTTNGTYTVELLVDDPYNSCQDTAFATVYVAVCNSFFWLWQDSININPSIYYAYNYSSGTNLTYLWDFGDGTTSTQQFPSHTYTTTGSYNVCLTVDNGNGCTDTHCDIILVTNKAATEVHLNILDPDNPTAGIEEQTSLTDVLVYPNPTEGDFIIQYTSLDNKVTMVKIIDTKGSLVYDAQINSQTGLNKIEIDLSEVEKGMYFYRIDSDIVGKVLVK